MPFDPELMDEEDTNVVVGRVRKAKRRMVAAIISPVVIALVLLALWMFTGHRSCGNRFWQGFERPGVSSKVPESWVVNPGSPTATLHITISESAKVWIDGEPIGQIEETSIELPPGEHDVLTRTRRGGEMSTTLTAKAGQVFKVFFNRDNNKIRLYRVGPDGTDIEVP